MDNRSLPPNCANSQPENPIRNPATSRRHALPPGRHRLVSAPRAARKHSHCCEGAIFAAAALRVNGFPPLLFDLEAEHDTDHVLAIYRVNGHWGAVAKSNYSGCRYREPVYRSLRELAMSYFNLYFNMRRERTLRTFSRPVNLARFDHLNWMTTEEPVWFIVNYLFEIHHYKLLRPEMIKRLHRLDERSVQGRVPGQGDSLDRKYGAKIGSRGVQHRGTIRV